MVHVLKWRTKRCSRVADGLRTHCNVSRGNRLILVVSVKKMVHHIATDYLGTSYYVLDFANELPLVFPWGSAMFDCQIFSPTNKNSPSMESLIFSLPYAQINWVHTSEPDSEYWHDKVDKASVHRRVQENVGDGKPMTAWFTDLLSPRDWKPYYNHGACPHFLSLFVEPKSPLAERMNVLRESIKAR